ncbi:hypothetical protein F3Y30_21850 (plasmid) [Sinorhizobium sp. BG8]|nr:hypothetical protein F3Y30_01045 [Sinorhizobium sp. BG8]QRM53698.1 hypothetical protein F3Y30_03325 [Sinorhizobium sp. BG8]QRM54333.1 hypothetical protein F3Y30_07040 [Sinorhizobium sp. BG8]QRM57173.1 hypothetical protein F3Y30_21850 [Sinorhizobium sp. BG8]
MPMLILSWIWNSLPPRLRSKGFQIWPYGQAQQCGYLLQPHQSDAIDVFDMSFIAGTPVHREVISLRPASRDLSGDARSGNIHQHAVRGSSNTKNPGALRSEASGDQLANNTMP